MSPDQIERYNPNQIEQLQNNEASHHTGKFAPKRPRKSQYGRTQKPRRLNGIAAPANGDGKVGRLNRDFRNMRTLAERIQYEATYPRVDLIVGILNSLQKRNGQQNVKQDHEKTEL